MCKIRTRKGDKNLKAVVGKHVAIKQGETMQARAMREYTCVESL